MTRSRDFTQQCLTLSVARCQDKLDKLQYILELPTCFMSSKNNSIFLMFVILIFRRYLKIYINWIQEYYYSGIQYKCMCVNLKINKNWIFYWIKIIVSTKCL